MTHDDSDSIDIYSDLPSFNYLDKISKLEQQNKILTERVKVLQVSLSDALREKEKFQEKCKTLSFNISSLLKTAQAELVRKNNTICELRSKYNDTVFRRKVISNEEEETPSQSRRGNESKSRRDSEATRSKSSRESPREKQSWRELKERKEGRKSCRGSRSESLKKDADRGVKVKQKTSEEKENITDNCQEDLPETPDALVEPPLSEPVVPAPEPAVPAPEPSVPPSLPTEYSRRMFNKIQHVQKSVEESSSPKDTVRASQPSCSRNQDTHSKLFKSAASSEPTGIDAAPKHASPTVEKATCNSNCDKIEKPKTPKESNLSIGKDASSGDKIVPFNCDKPFTIPISDVTSKPCDNQVSHQLTSDPVIEKENESVCNDLMIMLECDKAKENNIPCELFSLESLESFQHNSHKTNTMVAQVPDKNLGPVSPSLDAVAIVENAVNAEVPASAKPPENKNPSPSSPSKSLAKPPNRIPTRKAGSKPLIAPVSKTSLSRFHNVAIASASRTPVKSVISQSKLMESIFGSPLKWVDEDEDASKEKPIESCDSSEKLVAVNDGEATLVEKETLEDEVTVDENHSLVTTDTTTVSCKMLDSAIKTKIQTSQLIKYDDSTLGQFEDTIQFVSALSVFKPRVSPIGTPEKFHEPAEFSVFSQSSSKAVEPDKPPEIESVVNKFTPLGVVQKPEFKIVSPSKKPVNVLQPRKVPRKMLSAALNSSPPSNVNKSNMRISCLDNKAIASVCHLVRAIKKDGCSVVRETKLSPKKNKMKKEQKPSEVSNQNEGVVPLISDNCKEIPTSEKSESERLVNTPAEVSNVNSQTTKVSKPQEKAKNGPSTPGISCSPAHSRKVKLIESLPQFKKCNNLTKTNVVMRKTKQSSKDQNLSLIKKFEESISSVGVKDSSKVNVPDCSGRSKGEGSSKRKLSGSPAHKSFKRDSEERKGRRDYSSPDSRTRDSKKFKSKADERHFDDWRVPKTPEGNKGLAEASKYKNHKKKDRSEEKRRSPPRRSNYEKKNSYYLDKRMYYAERRGDKSYARRRERSVLREHPCRRKKLLSPVKAVKNDRSKRPSQEIRKPSPSIAPYDRFRGIATPGVTWRLIQVDNVPDPPALQVEPHPEDHPIVDKTPSSSLLGISSPGSTKQTEQISKSNRRSSLQLCESSIDSTISKK